MLGSAGPAGHDLASTVADYLLERLRAWDVRHVFAYAGDGINGVPVVAIVGQTNRSAMGGSYQQEVDLLSLFKDVASDYVKMVTVPEQLPNVLDRAIRVALAERAPTAIIIPADVQEPDHTAPAHSFKMVPSSLGVDWPVAVPDDQAIRRAADVLNRDAIVLTHFEHGYIK